jgi:multimeric flavodoxin WrbA
MKIMGILGSSRQGGNTEIMLDTALGEAKKNGVATDKISLSGQTIAPCDGCQVCADTGKCIIEDDAQEILDKMTASDGIIWATPVYFWSMTGQIKTLMDRTYALLNPKLQLANKVGGLITVAGARGCMNVANVFHQYFSYNHMFIAESATGYAREKGEIRQNAPSLNMAKEMARQMIALINAENRFPDEFDVPLLRFVKNKYSS